MRWKLNQLIAKCKDKGVHITYRGISKETGISTTAITKMARNQAKRADFSTMERLLSYFSGKLNKQLGLDDLIDYIPDTN